MTGTVFVHIGPGKTGTSTLQRALDEQRDTLRDLGILVPGQGLMDARHAVYDLMGRRIGGALRRENDRVTGAWTPYAASVAASPLPTAVFSEEMLALARPRAVRRLVDSLAPRRVVVVATVRDLGSVLGSYWQQMVMMGRTETLSDFLAAVRDPDSGPAGVGVGFWMRQDLLRALDAWERVVPRADVRLVTVPPPGAPPEVLADRFASAIGCPPGLLRSSRSRGNSSVGLAEIEVVRRLNLALGGALRENERLHLMQVLRVGLAGRGGRSIRIPTGELDWVRERTTRLVATLTERGYPVTGSLEELEPRAADSAADSAAEPVTEAELAAAGVAALETVAREQARLWTRTRRRGRGGPAADATVTSRPLRATAASRARAISFGLRTRALAASDRNPLLGRAARAYLRRTSPR